MPPVTTTTKLSPSLERAFTAAWPPGLGSADPTLFVRVFTDTCKATKFPVPPAQWFFLSFRNFDVDCKGEISKRDVSEVIRQYTDALSGQTLKSGGTLGSRAVNAPKGGHPKSDHRNLSMWIKDVTWQGIRWVDPGNKGIIIK